MKNKNLLALAGAVVLALAASTAVAESRSGYTDTGAGAVSATARVNVRVTVPKLVLLKVGSRNTTVDTVHWTAVPTIGGVAPSAGNNSPFDWDGTSAPTITAGTPTGAVVAVSTWTNVTGVSLSCSVGAWTNAGTSPATNPVNTIFTVSSNGLAHPGGNLGCGTPTQLTAKTLQTADWTYSMSDAAAAALDAGDFTAVVTYTAQGI